MEKFNKQIVKQPFSVFDSDLYRFTLFHFQDGTGGLNVTFHHIISDAWTMSLFINEVIHLYTSLLNGHVIDLSLNHSYLDYITAQQQYKNSEKYLKDAQFWKNEFSQQPNFAPILNYPSKTEKFNSKAIRKEFSFNANLYSRITSYCKSQHISVYTFLMAIYSLYLGKLNNVSNPVIGTPILNRSGHQEKHTAGMYINTIPFKVSIPDAIDFTSFVKSVAAEQMAVFRHQKYTYNMLLEELRKNDAIKDNLYDIAISYQNARDDKNTSGLDYETQWLFNGNIADSLEIHVYDMDDTGIITLFYDYQTEKFKQKDIESIHSRILSMIEQVLENPSKSLESIEIITPKEKFQILEEFNHTDLPYHSSIDVTNVLERQVQAHPDKIAVTFQKQSLTYQQLNEKANQVAHYLKNKSIQPNDIVAIMINRSLALPILMFGILKTGAAYLLIDPELPEDRILYMLENSQCKLLLTHSNVKEISFENRALVDSAITFSSYPTTNLDLAISTQNAFCVIYTSGSTGRPKGILLKRSSILNLVLSYQTILHTDECNYFFGISTVAFDMFIVETFVCLLSGKTLILANEEEQKVPVFMGQLMDLYPIDFILTTPSKMQLLLSDTTCQHNLKQLKVIQLGGEVFTPDLWETLSQYTKAAIYNGYGPSEATACASNKLIKDKDNITIGTPNCNTKLFICNDHLTLLPVGQIGEICITGDGIAKEYIHQPEITKKSFLPNPFGSGFLYKTGDLGKFNKNGEIEYIGRKDFQVKLRGLRIELNEIDNCIRNYPGVIHSVSVIKKVNSIDCICSYLVTNNDIKTGDVKSFVAKKLPYYMVPSHMLVVDHLPLTLNGKIDVNKLPDISVTASEYVAPYTAMQRALTKIWKDLLKLPLISIHSSFFELGGDSLCAIKLVSSIYTKFHIKIAIQDVFAYHTIESLAQYLMSKKPEQFTENVITKAPIAESYPLSSAQKRIYLTVNMEGESSITYNTPGAILLRGIVSASKLEKSIQFLLDKHCSFRTYFTLSNGKPVQKIVSHVDFQLSVLENGTDTIDALLRDFVKPFHLTVPPLFRATLIKRAKEEYVLLIDMHHIICDGYSVSLFINELCNLYNGRSSKETYFDYIDYSNWENNTRYSFAQEQHKEYWLDQFREDIPVLDLPTSFPRTNRRYFEGNRIHYKLGEDITETIKQYCQKTNSTPFMFLFSIYYILLYKYTHQNTITVGVPVIGREKTEFKDIIGMFVNTLALKQVITKEASLKDFLQQVSNYCMDAFEHQTYPFDKLVEKLNIPRNAGRNPMFDVMFVYQNNEPIHLNFHHLDASYYIPDTNISKFDITLEVTPDENHFDLSFEYCTKLFTQEFMESFACHYLTIVDSFLKEDSQKISNISLVSASEKQLLESFNDTSLPYEKEKDPMELFYEIAKENITLPAVIFENQTLTYQELDDKSNQLAHFLRAQSIGRNSIVAVMLNRSFDMIISMIGILKAGAGYFLIDPTLPEDRITFMIQNCEASFLITKSTMPEIKYSKVLFDSISLDAYSKSPIGIENENTDTFCLLYTSGSTGTPKGVELKRLGISNLLLNFQHCLHTDQCHTFLSTSTVSFDMFLVETFISLLDGKTIVLANEEEQKNPISTSHLIDKYRVDFMVTTPSKLDLLLAQPQTCQCLESLSCILLGGEVFTPNLYTQLRQHTHSRIYNGYGPSEITACCSYKEVTDANNVCIGKPFYNMQLYICDDDMNLCPIGVPGQICIAGDGLAKGYMNHPEITKQSFIPNPFGDGLLYLSGDIGKYTKQGELIYLGRNDFQIKIRGLRVELSEIEKQLLAIKNITNACVVYRDNSYIAAFVTSSTTLSLPEIRTELASHLPLYMIPKYIIPLEALPITPNGKVDKKVLLQYDISMEESQNYVAPQTEKEKIFCEIWEELLNTRVGIYDDVFELGADSLLAIKFKVQLLAKDIDIAYSDIFKYKTVHDLSTATKYITATKESYDYTHIDQLLDKNDIKYLDKNQKMSNNNILLLGSNGFIGMHILYSFIKNDTGNIYCVIRDKNKTPAVQRFMDILHFYFGDELDSFINKRIFILRGSVTQQNFGLSKLDFDTVCQKTSIVINAAALVKHYGSTSKFEDINVTTTKIISKFCLKYHKRFIHLSSLSISGNMSLEESASRKDLIGSDIDFTEKQLYIGQTLDNVYVYTKFQAERLILENCYKKGLQAQIIRLGNITSRYSDGKFQINPDENAFTNRLKTFIELKAIPSYLLNGYAEFTPVDLCSDAIIKIIQNPQDDFTVFHVYNPNHLYLSTLIELLKECHISIQTVSHEEFVTVINQYLQQHADTLSGIINDLNEEKKLDYTSHTKIRSDFTQAFLYHINFHWPKLDINYISKYIQYLQSIHFI